MSNRGTSYGSGNTYGNSGKRPGYSWRLNEQENLTRASFWGM